MEAPLTANANNRSAVIFGPSGSYKTSNLGFVAKWMYEMTAKRTGTGKKSRLITFDGGGMDPLVPYIDAGLIDAYVYTGDGASASPTLNKLSAGWWPDPEKPRDQSLVHWLPLDKFDPVGAYLIESTNSICAKLMEGLTETGPNLGQGASFKYTAKTDDGETYSQYGSSQAYYGHTQTMFRNFLNRFNRLPVERVVWSALEAEGTDDVTNSAVLGPATIGRALTGSIPQMMGECLHFEQYVKAEVQSEGSKTFKRKVMGVRAWFVSHPNPKTGKLYPCKARVPSDMIDQLNKIYPNGYVELGTTTGIEALFQAELDLMAKTTDTLSVWKQQLDNTGD